MHFCNFIFCFLNGAVLFRTYKSMAFDPVNISTPEVTWLLGVTVSGLQKVMLPEYARYLDSFEVWHVQFSETFTGICDHCALLDAIDRIPALAELRSLPAIAAAHSKSSGRKPLTDQELQLVNLQLHLNR
jgi:hypothetical protein